MGKSLKIKTLDSMKTRLNVTRTKKRQSGGGLLSNSIIIIIDEIINLLKSLFNILLSKRDKKDEFKPQKKHNQHNARPTMQMRQTSPTVDKNPIAHPTDTADYQWINYVRDFS